MFSLKVSMKIKTNEYFPGLLIQIDKITEERTSAQIKVLSD